MKNIHSVKSIPVSRVKVFKPFRVYYLKSCGAKLTAYLKREQVFTHEIGLFLYSLWNDCVYKQFFFRSGQMFIMGERISFVPFQGNWDVIQSNLAMLWIHIWKMRYCTFQKCKFIYSINLTINRIVQNFQFLDISFYIDMCISKPEI